MPPNHVLFQKRVGDPAQSAAKNSNISTLIESSKRSQSSGKFQFMADLEERTFAFVKFLVSADSEIYTHLKAQI